MAGIGYARPILARALSVVNIHLMRARVGELAHAAGEVLCDAPWCDLHLAPGALDVEKDEQVGGCVEAILAIVGSICPAGSQNGPPSAPTQPMMDDGQGAAVLDLDHPTGLNDRPRHDRV